LATPSITSVLPVRAKVAECILDILPAEFAALVRHLAEANSDNTMLIPWEIWRDRLMQDAPESVARSIWEQLSPEPNQVNLDKLDLKRYYLLAIPKSFIYCRQDKAMGSGYFIRECRRGSERSNLLRWKAAMRLRSRALVN
jgi:hypothetical protein